ncbi:MAG: glycine cleavage system protein H [Gracilibacter sp. BRH_c7a]|nr:MAG: glycine cleavage system protein H [Gracilibacter sp. BRH_c7a]
MKINKDLKYTGSHEWVRLEGNIAFIGITDYAQSHLGTIVFVELPEVGEEISKGAPMAVVESVKAASDVYTPLSGTVTAINEELMDDPEQINSDPYESWFVSLELSDSTELESLIDAEGYQRLSEQEE